MANCEAITCVETRLYFRQFTWSDARRLYIYFRPSQSNIVLETRVSPVDKVNRNTDHDPARHRIRIAFVLKGKPNGVNGSTTLCLKKPSKVFLTITLATLAQF